MCSMPDTDVRLSLGDVYHHHPHSVGKKMEAHMLTLHAQTLTSAIV